MPLTLFTSKRLILIFLSPLDNTPYNMAGRRGALKAIDWLAFAERVPPSQRTMFNNLKTRSDAISAKFVFPLHPISKMWHVLIVVIMKNPNIPFNNQMICVHRLTSLPEKPATIDWSYYRSAVAKAGMVDEFEKKVREDQKVNYLLPASLTMRYWNLILLLSDITFCFLSVQRPEGSWACRHSDSSYQRPGGRSGECHSV